MSESRVAIVTGGSRGIGRAIVETLAQDGYSLLISYRRRADEAAAVVDAVRSAGGAIEARACDTGERDACLRLVQAALDTFGRVDVLVNNAGMHYPGLRLAECSAEQWERILQVNLNGPVYLAQAVLPAMRAQRGGNIVNLSSNVTQRLPANYGPYTVSKVGLEAFTRILAKEEGQYGIRVNAVAPGPIHTDMLQESLDVMGVERATAFLRSTALGRGGEPREIAAMVRFLVSDAASYVTGQTMYVNGGGPGG